MLATGAGTHKRVNASRLVRRLRSTPVALFPRELGCYLAECRVRQPPGAPSASAEWGPGVDGSASRGNERVIPVPSNVTAASFASAEAAAGGGGGLGANDIVVVGRNRESQEAVTEWTYHVAAAHALRGGRVVYVYTPGSGAMQLRRFASCMERLVVSEQSAPGKGEKEGGEAVVPGLPPRRNGPVTSPVSAGRIPDDLSDSGNPPRYNTSTDDDEEEEARALHRIRRQQQRVLSAMGRVDAVHCHTVEELYAFCSAYQIPPDSLDDDTEDDASDFTTRAAKRRRHTPTTAEKTLVAADSCPTSQPVVPLIIVEGSGGENSHVYRYERAAGQEVPLRHWLLCLLQRRSLGALVLVEDVSAAQQQRQCLPLTGCTSASIADVLLVESDLVARLVAPHEHRPLRHPTPNVRSARPATTAAPGRREKQRRPVLLLPDETTGGDFSFFQPPPPAPLPRITQAGFAAAERQGETAAHLDQQLPVADIGGYTLTYLMFGTATSAADRTITQEIALLAVALNSR